MLLGCCMTFSMQAGDKFYRTEYDEVGMFRNAEEAAALGLSLDGWKRWW